ncbi:MAG TPA: response regulator [Longimicrobiales bacterium]|nr:response regulator [Longimicrobiales bacterium]
MRGRSPVLLVIEDARDQAILVGVAARRAHPGLDVRIADDGLEGIAYLAGTTPFEDRRVSPHPDLVILDLLMPEVDGFEVLSYVRSRLSPAAYPVVVLTSSTDPRHEARALELGASDVYRKPAELGELGRIVREIVDRWIGVGDIIGAHIGDAG